MVRRKSAAWALLLVVALAGGCGREASFKAAEEEGGVQIDWSSVTPAEVEELIAKGELNAKGFYQDPKDKTLLSSPLMRLVGREGNPAVADVLHKHGANIDYYFLQEENKTTALDIAVYNGNIPMAQRLLELGASIEKEDGRPTVYFLFGKDKKPERCKEMLDLLLEYGADINALDYNGKEYNVVLTPLMRLMERRIFHVIPGGYPGIISCMVSRGADINMRPPGSVATAMNYAAMDTDAYVIEELISLGGDVNLQSDVDCWTPLLFYAAFGRSIEVFDVLIDNGANLDYHNCHADRYDILDVLAMRRHGELFQSPVLSAEEGWHDFGDKIIGRIAELCEDAIYEICLELEEKT